MTASPLCSEVIPATCHPPKTASATPLMSPRNWRPWPNGKFIEVADGEAVAQVGHDGAVLQIGAIRILDEAADVAVGIAQVLGEGVRRQEIETVGEAFVQRCLECVVEHLQLRKVQRQDCGHVRLLVEIAPSKVRNAVTRVGAAEVGVQNLQRLVQIAGFVVPQMIGASSDVSDLSQKVVLELVLHAQVPFHDAGNGALWSRGLYRAADVDGVSYRQAW